MIGRRPVRNLTKTYRAGLLAATAIGALALAAPVTAQQYLGSSNVVIDMSALGGPAPAGSRTLGRGGQSYVNEGIVLFPPSQTPVSRLQGPLANQNFNLTAPQRPTLQRPPAAAPQSQTSVATAPSPAPAPTPAPAPNLPVATAPAPAPTTAPAPDLPVATAPAPAPAAPQVTAPPPPPSTAEAPVQAPASAPAPPVQTAAVPPAANLPAGETRILFEAGSPDLSDAARATLDSLAASLNADESLRIQLQAFAAGTDDTAPEARRLSLKRALNVRAYLVERDVRNTRMDVRALGVKSGGGPADRVDAVIVQR